MQVHAQLFCRITPQWGAADTFMRLDCVHLQVYIICFAASNLISSRCYDLRAVHFRARRRRC